MKIPSSIGSFQFPPAAQTRSGSESQAREALAGGTERERAARDDATGAAGPVRARPDAALASASRVQRIDQAENTSGPGRQALAAYLAVALNSVPDAFDVQLAGIDILV